MVVADAPLSVPVIAPVDVFKDAPPANEPLAIEYARVESPDADIVAEILPPAEKVPRVPDAVFHVGESDTVSNAELDLTAKPSGFSTLIKYVPSVVKVKLATIVVALVKVTEFAVIIAPLLDIASTFGTDTKPVPVIVTLVAVFSIVLGDILETAGFVVVDWSVKLKVPDPSVFIT